jgi:serine/threonine protein kinase
MSNTLYISGACLRSGLGLTPDENSAHLIELDDRPLPKAGAHGAIFRVRTVDGIRVSGKLVKRISGGFPPDLKDIVNALRVNVGGYPPEERASLCALPLFLFESSLGGEPFDGYLMREVEGRTFLEILTEDINEYINLPLETRLLLCLQFVEGMNVLYGCGIIHTDLNAQNLILDLPRRRLAIIDLDGGAVANTASIPVALKFEPGWLAPEIDRQLVGSTRRAAAVLDTRIDLWSIACGIHHLLFGLSPFFFIANQPDVETYLKRHRWPSLKDLSEIEVQNTEAFDYFERAYAAVPELHPLLQQSFQNGYLDPSLRINPYHWMRVLHRMLLQVSSPGSTAEALKQVRRYLNLTLDEGGLTSGEKEFILDQGKHLGIAQGELERVVEEEVRNWWNAIDEAVTSEKSGQRAPQPEVAPPQSLRAFHSLTGTRGFSLTKAATIAALLVVCLAASISLNGANDRGGAMLISRLLAMAAPPQAQAPAQSSPVQPKAPTAIVRRPRVARERLASEVRRLINEQGFARVSAKVRRPGKVYLYGTVSSPEQVEDVVWAVGTIGRVRDVIARLTVKPVRIDEGIDGQRAYKRPPLGVVIEDAPAGGALVVNVKQQSPAQSAGILPSDVITELDGKPVSGRTALKRLLRQKDAEQVVRLTIDRDGTRKLVEVQLGSSEP